MNATLARLFGPEWLNVRTVVIDNEEMHMAHDICEILGLSNVTFALRGVSGSYNVSPNFRTKEKIDDWCTFRKIHLLTLDGVFQLVMNNKSPECKRIKEYMAANVLPANTFRFRYRSGNVEA